MDFHSSALGLTHGNNFRYRHALKMNVMSGGSARGRHIDYNRSGVGSIKTHSKWYAHAGTHCKYDCVPLYAHANKHIGR